MSLTWLSVCLFLSLTWLSSSGVSHRIFHIIPVLLLRVHQSYAARCNCTWISAGLSSEPWVLFPKCFRILSKRSGGTRFSMSLPTDRRGGGVGPFQNVFFNGILSFGSPNIPRGHGFGSRKFCWNNLNVQIVIMNISLLLLICDTYILCREN